MYIVTRNIDVNDVILQKEELEKVDYFTIEEFINMVNTKDERLTDTPILFEHLIDYIKSI